MVRTLLALLLVLFFGGCGGTAKQPPANQKPPRDWAEFEGRFHQLEVGMSEAKVAAWLGKRGHAIAGYSFAVAKHKPDGVDPGGGSVKYWASDDWTGAIRAVFRTDAQGQPIASSFALLRLTPMGPPP